MTDSLSDDARLTATEAQMRRALGLKDARPVRSEVAPQPASPGGAHPQRRRFIRDGEVPVSVIHRDQDDGAGANKLDASRQALREQVAARDRAEHLLQDAEATIRDLQTKLAHERLARDEAIQRVGIEKQLVEQALQGAQAELAVERASRQKAEQERDAAVAGPQEAEERLRAVEANQEARTASHAMPSPTQNPTRQDANTDTQADGLRKACEAVSYPARRPRKAMPAIEPPAGSKAAKRGRPAQSDQSEADIVEWWKPGWRERFR